MKYKQHYRLTRHRQRGVYLIEVLIAALIFAVGLLSVALLQVTGLKNTDSAAFYSQATTLATEIIDRMRINRDSARAGNYDVALTVTPTGGTIEATDLINWKADLNGRLPSGDGAVDCTTTAGLCVVTVQWDDSRATAGNAAKQITLRTRI